MSLKSTVPAPPETIERGRSGQTKKRKWRSAPMEDNTWMKWAEFTAKSIYSERNCYVCSTIRPRLMIVPASATCEEDMANQESGKEYEEDMFSPFCCLRLMGSEEGKYCTGTIS